MAEDSGAHRGPAHRGSAHRHAQDEYLLCLEEFLQYGNISDTKDSTGNLVKGPQAYCKLCFQLVAHGGGTTNLRSHLHLNHLPKHSNPFPDEKTDENKQPKIEEFTRPAATLSQFPSCEGVDRGGN